MKKIKIYADELTFKKVFDILNIDHVALWVTDKVEINFQASKKLEKEIKNKERIKKMANKKYRWLVKWRKEVKDKDKENMYKTKWDSKKFYSRDKADKHIQSLKEQGFEIRIYPIKSR